MSQHSLLRQRLAEECARLMSQEGVDDFQTAKNKAAARLGANKKHLPSNSEIEQALQQYQRLFRSDAQHQRLRAQREAALQAMRFLAEFEPRLVGSVLSGTAHEHAGITLHLFSDSAEDIGFFLMQQNIPYEPIERRFFGKRGSQPKSYPGYRFWAGDEEISLIVFPHNEIRQPPRDPVDGKAMRRADHKTVAQLLADADPLDKLL